MGKDTKRQLNRINVKEIGTDQIYEFKSSMDQLFILNITQDDEEVNKIVRNITFKFLKPDISSKIDVRVVIEQPVKVFVNLLIITEEGVRGIESTMDMRALLINDSASIQFVPSLEIDEMNVSVDHKSSVGALTPQWIEYLSSRGLDKTDSVKLLKDAFLRL